MKSRDELIAFVKAKIADAERAIKGRRQERDGWRSGTNESWRAVGCRDSKLERLKEADAHERILIKQLRELEMFEGVLQALQTVR